MDIVKAAGDKEVQCHTIFISICVYTPAAFLLYAYAWPHMTLDMGDLLPRYEWALKWLEQSSQMWKMVEGWLGTLWTILTL